MNIINSIEHNIGKPTEINRDIISSQRQTSIEILKEKWPEIIAHMVKENHIDSLSHSMYLKPMKPDTIDDSNPLCWHIIAKMENFDKNLDTYVDLKYSDAICNSIKDVLGTECTFKLYSEGCKGTARIHSISRALSYLFYNHRKKEAKEADVLEAMAMFKINSINSISKETLKHKRNKLLKIYHPDESGLESRFAERINHAYQILCDYVQ